MAVTALHIPKMPRFLYFLVEVYASRPLLPDGRSVTPLRLSLDTVPVLKGLRCDMTAGEIAPSTLNDSEEDLLL